MDLQSAFYIVAIILMITLMGIIVGTGIVLYQLRKKFLVLAEMASRPAETAALLGAGLIESLALKFKDWTSSSVRKR